MKLFKVGDKVKVSEVAADEFKPTGFNGKFGLVAKLMTDDCGAAPEDPLYTVRFSAGKRDAFWQEELVSAYGQRLTRA